MSNTPSTRAYRQRKRAAGYKRLDVWIPAYCWRNLQEMRTDYDRDIATVLVRLLRHRRRSRGWKNAREAFLDSIIGPSA